MGIEVKDQKAVVLSRVSSKCSKVVVGAVPKISELKSKSVERAAVGDSTTLYPDPTRFGDWEQAGRCIDF